MANNTIINLSKIKNNEMGIYLLISLVVIGIIYIPKQKKLLHLFNNGNISTLIISLVCISLFMLIDNRIAVLSLVLLIVTYYESKKHALNKDLEGFLSDAEEATTTPGEAEALQAERAAIEAATKAREAALQAEKAADEAEAAVAAVTTAEVTVEVTEATTAATTAAAAATTAATKAREAAEAATGEAAATTAATTATEAATAAATAASDATKALAEALSTTATTATTPPAEQMAPITSPESIVFEATRYKENLNKLFTDFNSELNQLAPSEYQEPTCPVAGGAGTDAASSSSFKNTSKLKENFLRDRIPEIIRENFPRNDIPSFSRKEKGEIFKENEKVKTINNLPTQNEIYTYNLTGSSLFNNNVKPLNTVLNGPPVSGNITSYYPLNY
jgi:hypothetical protein